MKIKELENLTLEITKRTEDLNTCLEEIKKLPSKDLTPTLLELLKKYNQE